MDLNELSKSETVRMNVVERRTAVHDNTKDLAKIVLTMTGGESNVAWLVA